MALSWPFLLLAPYPMGVLTAMPAVVQKQLMRLLTSVGCAAADQRTLEERPELGYLLMLVLQQSVAQGVQGVVHDMTITSNTWSFKLEDIKVPLVMVFQGDDDVNVPKEMADQLAAQIPGAIIQHYPGEGHFSLLLNRTGDMLLQLQAAINKQ